MRVANIIEEGKLGGPQVRISAVAAMLNSQCDTTVIMPIENSTAFIERCSADNITYIALPLTRITKEWKSALRYLIFSIPEICRLALIFRKYDFDIVHVSGGSWQFKGVIAGKLAGRKVLWHLNDTHTPYFIRVIFRILNKLADGFIFASERSRDYYSPLLKGQKPTFLVPAPVDTSFFDPAISHMGDHELIEKLSGKFIIGTVCNINPTKGLDVFIKAAALINSKINNAYFIVIGPVFDSQKRHFDFLKYMCKTRGVWNIEFLGARDDIRPLLSRFDIYVCSSRAESSPISVWEAMAMAKPVISTDVGDVGLYISSGKNGFIVAVNDAAQLAEKVLLLGSSRKLQAQFGHRSREIAISELEVSRCVELHANAYSALVG